MRIISNAKRKKREVTNRDGKGQGRAEKGRDGTGRGGKERGMEEEGSLKNCRQPQILPIFKYGGIAGSYTHIPGPIWAKYGKLK